MLVWFWFRLVFLYTFANLYLTSKADTKTPDFHEICMTTAFNEVEPGSKQESDKQC